MNEFMYRTSYNVIFMVVLFETPFDTENMEGIEKEFTKIFSSSDSLELQTCSFDSFSGAVAFADAMIQRMDNPYVYSQIYVQTFTPDYDDIVYDELVYECSVCYNQDESIN